MQFEELFSIIFHFILQHQLQALLIHHVPACHPPDQQVSDHRKTDPRSLLSSYSRMTRRCWRTLLRFRTLPGRTRRRPRRICSSTSGHTAVGGCVSERGNESCKCDNELKTEKAQFADPFREHFFCQTRGLSAGSLLFTFRRFRSEELLPAWLQTRARAPAKRSKFQLNVIKVISLRAHTCSSQLVISSMVSCCEADRWYMQFSFQLFSLWWDFQNIWQELVWWKKRNFAESFTAQLSKVSL